MILPKDGSYATVPLFVFIYTYSGG